MLMNEIKLQQFENICIELPDKTQLKIIFDGDNIDIFANYCDILIKPMAENRVKLIRDEIKVPKHIIINKDSNKTKKCSKCGNEKEENEFYKNSKNVCIECQNKKRKSNFLPFSEMIKKDIKI
jgi:NAD-dependent SIR2 family protein deacetylase